MDEHEEIDLDQFFGIADIKKVISKDRMFYIMSNKRDGKIGYYLLKISEENPC